MKERWAGLSCINWMFERPKPPENAIESTSPDGTGKAHPPSKPFNPMDMADQQIDQMNKEFDKMIESLK